ncbi:hypothetical protein GF376_02875 [Candidatus Peregrinibacteria bacterium]|nr:hypothetical protein [Candidatus Peregrinibacteria bacterium]
MTKSEQLQKEIIKLLELSSMDEKERMLWTILMPNMEESELKQLHKTLEKEVNALTDIYVEAIKERKKHKRKQ